MFVMLCVFASLWSFADRPVRSHAITMYGVAKHPKNFDHLSFVNPNAPKGGTIVLGAVGGFDSLNGYALKGNGAPGLAFLSDSLTTGTADDPLAHYCLVCDWMEYPKDRSYITFHIHPRAKFQDGSPITAEDVAFSFTALTNNLPQYKNYYAAVKPPKVLDPLTVRFDFKSVSNELPVILGELPVLSKAYWTAQDISKTTLKPPMGSGPYRIKSFETGRSITYIRNAEYWARDLPLRRGFNNFEQIRIDIYNDYDVELEAFKGGAYDYRQENVSKFWAQGYESEGLRKGQLKKELIPDNTPQGFQGMAFNTRRPYFKDPKVREALTRLFDFEWMNKNLFFGAYTRCPSYFSNSPMAATGLPRGEELEILKKHKDQIPPEVFSQVYAPPTNATEDDRRSNLRAALKLFGEAGWSVQDGKMKNAAGDVLSFEFMIEGASFEKLALAYQQSLEKVGISLRPRKVDAAQYINRLRDYDFDMIIDRQGESDTPGNEQRDLWSSASAKEKGAHNYVGASSPAIDKIVKGLIAAKSQASLTAHVRALDRVLVWSHYHVPQYYLPFLRLAYWDKFGRPSKPPPRGASFDTWWLDPIKDAALKRARE